MIWKTKPTKSHFVSKFITVMAVALGRSCVVTILVTLPGLFSISTSIIIVFDVVVVGIVLAVILIVDAALILVVMLLVLVLAIFIGFDSEFVETFAV